jgi:hypothetical protein
MVNQIKDFIEIDDVDALDALIGRLVEIRETLPANARPQVEMSGGQRPARLRILYERPLNPDEEASDARYADAYRQARARQQAPAGDHAGLRIVA